MALFGRGKSEPISIESEQERLHAIRIAAEQELGRLRRELTERVAAVEQRERELGRRGRTRQPERDLAHPATTTRSSTPRSASQRTRTSSIGASASSLRASRLLLRMESDLARRAAAAAETPEERLAHIEERIAALHEAEKAFARTQAELAARSADLATREAALAENARSASSTPGP